MSSSIMPGIGPDRFGDPDKPPFGSIRPIPWCNVPVHMRARIRKLQRRWDSGHPVGVYVRGTQYLSLVAVVTRHRARWVVAYVAGDDVHLHDLGSVEDVLGLDVARHADRLVTSHGHRVHRPSRSL